MNLSHNGLQEQWRKWTSYTRKAKGKHALSALQNELAGRSKIFGFFLQTSFTIILIAWALEREKLLLSHQLSYVFPYYFNSFTLREFLRSVSVVMEERHSGSVAWLRENDL